MNLGCSSEKTTTSSSSTETKKIPTHVVNLKESKTHLFYVIQSDNENHDNAQHLVQLRVSKEGPPSRKFPSQKMRLRYNNDAAADENRERAKRTQIPSRLASIHKRTDHPSFVVLPEVVDGRRTLSQNVEKNPSTSEHSNETYVIRSKNDSRACESPRKMPRLVNALWTRNSETVDGLNNSVANEKTDDFCECDKGTANRSRNSLKLANKIETAGSAQNTSPCYLRKEDLFNINYVDPTQNSMPQRLRAGQDYDRRYKFCHMCPNMTRIFPPASSRRPAGLHSTSDSTLNDRGGYTKINFKLVRQCLINGTENEKTEILDAIRIRMKSSDSNGAISTIEDIVKFDLFGVHCECRSKSLLVDLLWPLTPSHQLQTSIAKFVNAMVSYKLGRGYFNNRSVIGMLTWGDIGRDGIDQIMGDNLMGIMMKLSVSRFQRNDMIKNGLIPWLLQRMQEEEYSASKYHLQCMAGLLRNLLRGFSLENVSSTEMNRLIVLLGRYLDREDVIAKRYVCDSLMILFQNMNCVTSAKDLNFQRIIQEHAANAADPVHKEHLGVIYRLLNRSATSTSPSSQKFDFRSEEEPFPDADLEQGGEVDCYPGECLIREKFTGDGDTQDKTTDEPIPIADDDARKRDKLLTRVFVEHLNSFLPNIENNRIFPLYNSRCADKIRTCSHVGDIQSKKRQPYIPPNSRLSRHRQSLDDSIPGTSNVDYNKSTMKSQPSDKESMSTERLVSRVSTISRDVTAAKWDHIGPKHGDDNSASSKSTDGSVMEKIFESRSRRDDDAIYGEEIISNVSYRQDLFGAVGVTQERIKNDENVIDDRRRGQQSPHAGKETNEDRKESKREGANTESVDDLTSVGTNKDRDKTARTETKDRKESQRDGVHTESVGDLISAGTNKNRDQAARTQTKDRKTSQRDGANTESVGDLTSAATNKDRDKAARTETKDRKESQRDGANTESVEDLDTTTSTMHTKEPDRRHADLLRKATSQTKPDASVASHGLDSNVQKTSFGKEKPNELSAQHNLDAEEVTVDENGRRQLSHIRLVDTNFRQSKHPDSEQETALEEARLKASSATRGVERDDATQVKDRQITLRAKSERNQTRMVDNENARGASEEPLTNSERDPEKYHKNKAAENLETKEMGHQFPAHSYEMIAERKTDQQAQLNVRPEKVVTIGTSSKDNEKMDGKATGVRLKVRSEENVRDLASRGSKLRKSRSTNEKRGLTLPARSQLFSVKTETGNRNKKLKPVRSEIESVVKETVTKDVRAKETATKLNVRSEDMVMKQREKGEGLLSPLTATPKLHARSMEMLKDSKDVVESSHKPLRKSKSNDANIQGIRLRPRTPPSSQPTTTAKPQNAFRARSVEYGGANYQLFKSSSEELLGSTKNQDYSVEPTGNDNFTSRTKLLHPFNVRSKEFVGRTQSATFMGQNSSGSYQSSKHCVDCTGSGYVLRARPSQPCDRCKVSLSKYRDFVDALSNQDYHRRDVTRTDDEWIRTDLINKTDGKLNAKPNQENRNKESLGKSKIGEQSVKTKRNANGNVGKSNATQEKRPTEKSDKKGKQNRMWGEDQDGDVTISGAKVNALVESETTSGDKEITLSSAEASADAETTYGLKDNEDESVTDEVLPSGETKKLVSVSSISKQPENVSNTTPQSVNTRDAAGLSKSELTVVDGCRTDTVIKKGVLGEEAQFATNLNRGEHLVFGTAIETTKPILISGQPVEMNANVENDLHPMPKVTETKKHQHSSDGNTSNRMSEAGPWIGQSSEQMDEKDDAIGNNQHATVVHKSETLSTTPTTKVSEHTDYTKRGSRDVKNEVVFGRPDSEAVDFGLMATSDNENDNLRSRATIEEKVVADHREETILLKASTGVTDLMTTTTERVAIGRTDPNLPIDFSHAIGETIISSQRIGNEETTISDNKQRNVVNTSNDKKIREAMTVPETELSLPVTLHLFPRSTEIMKVINATVDDANGRNESDENENSAHHLTGKTNDTATGSCKETETECSDMNTERIELKDQPSSLDNTKLNDSPNDDNVSVIGPQPQSITTKILDHLKTVEPPFLSSAVSKRQENQGSFNVPALTARSNEAVPSEYPGSSDQPMNVEKSELAEASVSSPLELLVPAESMRNVGSDIASAPQDDNEIPLSEPLKIVSQNKVAEMTAGPLLPTGSNENITGISAQHVNQDRHPEQNDKRHTIIVPIPSDLGRVENLDRKTRQSNSLSPRSNVMIPVRNQKQDDTKVKQQIQSVTRRGTVTEQGNDAKSIDIAVRKPIVNKSSVVLDEAFVEERHLHSVKPTAKSSNDTEIEQQLDLDGVGYFSDGNIDRSRLKVKVVNSTCCRRLLNNDELITRLSEKVLEKLTNKIHHCGPNCKSPCGRLNSLFNAKDDNNLNWQ